MKLKARINFIVRDIYGKVVLKKRQLSHSFVLALTDILYLGMSRTSISVIDTSNTSRALGNHAINFSFTTTGGQNDTGIVVGTGFTAVAIGNYGLETIIAHGTGAGQLSYGTGSVAVPVTSGSTRKFWTVRTFTNNSGAAITVKECGIYCIAYDGAANRYFCISRDVLASPVAVGNGETLTVTYTISVTV